MAKKIKKEILELELENFQERWGEMTPSELRQELSALERASEELFSSLREKRAVLRELRRYIENIDDYLYDPEQND